MCMYIYIYIQLTSQLSGGQVGSAVRPRVRASVHVLVKCPNQHWAESRAHP